MNLSDYILSFGLIIIALHCIYLYYLIILILNSNTNNYNIIEYNYSIYNNKSNISYSSM